MLLLEFGLLAGAEQPWGGRPAAGRDAPSPPDMQLGRWLTLASQLGPSDPPPPLIGHKKMTTKKKKVYSLFAPFFFFNVFSFSDFVLKTV